MAKSIIVYRGDDTDSFGNTFIKVDLEPAQKAIYNVNKLEVSVANIVKTYLNPTFPLDVSLTAEETTNVEECKMYPVYVTLYDDNDKIKTFKSDINVLFKDRS